MSDNPMGSEHMTESQILEQRIENFLDQDEVKEEITESVNEAVEEVGAETTEEVEEIVNEVTDEDESPDTETEEPETSEASEFETLDDIAEALELSSDQFMENYKVKVKVDGEEFETSLAELKSGYQKGSDYTKKTMEVAEQRKELQAAKEKADAEYQERLGQVDALVDNLESQLMSEFQQVNWQELRDSNPGEFAALWKEYESRQVQINQAQEAVKQEREKLNAEAQEKQAEQFKAFIEQEQQKLLNAIPQWQDKAVLETEYKELTDSLMGRGFSAQEINSVADHRIIKLAYDLMTLDKVKGKADTVKNKVKTLPKLVKPGAKQSKSDVKKVTDKKLRANLKKTGGKDGTLEAMLLNRI